MHWAKQIFKLVLRLLLLCFQNILDASVLLERKPLMLRRNDCHIDFIMCHCVFIIFSTARYVFKVTVLFVTNISHQRAIKHLVAVVVGDLRQNLLRW